jgi:hypothetical protein
MDTESTSCSRLSIASESLTEAQKRYFELLKTQGSIGKTARVSGVHYSTVAESLASVAKKLGFDCLRSLVAEYGKVDENVAKTKERKQRRGQPLVRKIVEIVEKQEFRCALSGVPLLPETSNLDHKHPVSLGGTDNIDNLQWLSTEVNKAKGNMPNEDFILMCKRVAAWNR